jgi:hypothetical protein
MEQVLKMREGLEQLAIIKEVMIGLLVVACIEVIYIFLNLYLKK